MYLEEMWKLITRLFTQKDKLELSEWIGEIGRSRHFGFKCANSYKSTEILNASEMSPRRHNWLEVISKGQHPST